MTKPITVDAPDSTREFINCIDCKLQQRWPRLTAVRLRLIQATLVSFLIGGLAYGLEASPLFAIGAIVATNAVLLADIAAVAEVRLGTDGLEIRMRDDEE